MNSEEQLESSLGNLCYYSVLLFNKTLRNAAPVKEKVGYITKEIDCYIDYYVNDFMNKGVESIEQLTRINVENVDLIAKPIYSEVNNTGLTFTNITEIHFNLKNHKNVSFRFKVELHDINKREITIKNLDDKESLPELIEGIKLITKNIVKFLDFNYLYELVTVRRKQLDTTRIVEYLKSYSGSQEYLTYCLSVTRNPYELLKIYIENVPDKYRILEKSGQEFCHYLFNSYERMHNDHVKEDTKEQIKDYIDKYLLKEKLNSSLEEKKENSKNKI